MPWNKTDRSFKTLINKRVTDSDAKFYFNEKGDFTINTHQLELWVDAVPSTAPGATTDVVEYYNTLTLVEDTSVPSKQTWFATSNSSTVPAQTDETSRLKNWVSDKYGSTYEVVLYDTSNVQIPSSDGCGWFFDYQTGILAFSSTTTTTGGGGSLSSRAPFKIKGYRYIGRTGLDGNIIKNEVRVATTPATSFSGWSYSSELIDTGVTSATLSIDGVTLSTTEGLTGDRILIKNWSTLSNNGIYYVERAGDGASDTWRFRRAPDFNDTQDIFPGTMVFVRSGTVNARTVWSMSNASFTTLDAGGSTGEITFAQFITATTRWSALTAPDANLSLSMSTYATTLNWATGTSTNNLFSLTTDASANGTGALLNLATGSSSTVLPLLVKAGATTALTVNASAQVLVGTLTSGRVTYAGTNGLLQDSANMTFDGNRISLATTGNTGGLLIGGDANLYRSAADVLKTDDSFVVGVNLSVLNAGTFSLYESGSGNFSSFAAGSQSADLRYTLPTSQPSTNQVLTASSVTGSGPYDIALGWSTPSGGVTIGSSVSGGTSGSVLFVGAGPVLAQDNSNFFWDDTNNTLGIGTTRTGAISGTNPSARILGTGTTSSTSSFEVQDSSTATLFFVRNDGYVGIGTNVPTSRLYVIHTHSSDASLTLHNNILSITSAQTGQNIKTLFNQMTLNTSGAISPSGSGVMSNIWNQLVVASAHTGAITIPTYGLNNEIQIAQTGSTTHTLISGIRSHYNLSTGADGTITAADGVISTLQSGTAVTTTITTFTHYNTSYSLSGSPVIGTLTGVDIKDPGAGTVTTQYGIRVRDQSRGSTNYALYFDGTSGLPRQGIWWNGDTNLYRSGADTLKTDDSLVIAANLSILNAGTFSLYESGSVNFSSFAAGSQSNDIRYTLPTTQPSANQILSAPVVTGSGPYDVTLSWVTPATSGITIGDGITGSTVGSVLFVGAGSTLAQDNANLFWDDTNNTLGIGTTRTGAISGTNPSMRILGTGTSSATSSFEVQNSAAAVLFFVRDDGVISFGTAGSFTNSTGQLALSTTGSGAGILIGGDANLYRSAADVLKTDDSLVVGVNLTVNSLTTTRVPFASTSGLLIDSSAFTYTTGTGQLSLSTTGSGGGILIGGDVQLYRDAADVWRTPDSVRVDGTMAIGAATSSTISLQTNATHSVAGTAYTGIAVNLTHNATGTVTSRVFGMTFAVSQTGGGTFDDAGQLGCAGIEGSASFSGSVTSRGAIALIGTSQNTGSGTLERCVALFANTTGANTSSGHITNLRSIDVGWDTTFTANDQRRTALRIGVGPTNAGSFSGCIGGAVWFNSSSRLAVDGLLWGTGGDTNLYSSASDTLKTDDSLVVGVNLTVNSLTTTRVPFASTSGLLVDSSSFTYTTGTGQLALATTGPGAGILIGGDAQLYRSAADTLRTPDSLIVDVNLTVSGVASIGTVSGTTGTINLLGSTSGIVSVLVQATAGTYNFNLPTTAGSSGHVLTSGGGAGAPMTWTDPAALAVRWNAIVSPNGNQSLTMSTNTTTWNWATGTSTNNLFNLTTDASANGTGALLRIATGASSTVVPLLVAAAGTTALTVNASAQVLVNSLTSGRVTYAGTNGLLQDSANMTFDGNKLSLATTGSSGGLLIGGDTNLYRSAGDVLRTDDSFVVGVNLSVLDAGTFSLYESGSVNFSSFTAGTQANDLRYTLPTSQPSTNQVLTATSISGSGPYDITLSWVTNSASITIGDTVNSGTTGSILFVGSGPVLAQDNANLFWDDANNTFGIGTTRTGAISGTNPSMRIIGTGASSATSSFEVQDSGANTILFARNDSRVGVGTNSPSYDLSFGGESARTLGSNRRTTGAGNNLTVQAGGAQSGGSNLAAGNLILSAGTATGNSTGYVDIHAVNNIGLIGGTSDNNASFHVRFGSGKIGIGTTTLTYDMTLASLFASSPYTYAIGMLDSTLTSGHSLQIQAGHAITTADINGGSVILTAGNSTGSGSSNIIFQTATAGASSTTVRTSSTKMTLTGAGQLQISTTGSAAGLLIGGDANLYRSAADVLRTDDSFVVGVNLTVSSLTITRVPFVSTSGLLVDSSSFTYTTGTGQLAVATTGSGAGILIGGDAQLYRSAADTLRTPDSLIVDVNLTVSGTASIGAVGGTTGTINLLGSTSGTVSVLVQAAAGTYNFNLPTTAGSSGDVLTSAGGGGTAMTWTAPGALAVRWNSIVSPTGNQSLTMSTNITTWNWATGTSTNNLFNLTTDASANGTGALLRIATGASSTVVPMLVVAAGVTALTINASAQVLVGTLSSGRVTYAGTSGLLQDSANMTFDSNRLSLATTGSSGGLLIGGDTNLYRSAADVLKTDDAFVALKYNNITITQPVTGATLTIVDGSTFTVSATATVSNGTHSGINTGDETAETIQSKTGYTQSFLLMGA